MCSKESIHSLVQNQKSFFSSGKTFSVSWRIKMLKLLRSAIIENRSQIEKALFEDLGKSSTESYLCDIGPTILEINEIISHIRRWSRPELHLSGLLCFPSIFTRVYKVPYGVTLIISPYNFPILLSLGVLAASISAGNTAVLKVSSKSKASSSILSRIIRDIFPPEYVSVVEGGHEVADYCLSERFDKIFYTGSPKVAKHVLAEAAKNLTPVALELGGEAGNWCVIRSDANLEDAARKIAFIKLCNAGQICININQVAVARDVATKFTELLKQAFIKQIGECPLQNPDYPKLISVAAYEKCLSTLERYRDKIVFGGHGDTTSLKFEPTILYPINFDDGIVRSELFNPLLPIVPFEDDEISKVLDVIDSREHPLALYIFTKNIKWAKSVMKRHQYGGGCVNETCVHLMVRGVPFNGVGHSGMGAYHGIWGFREFSHPSTVLFGKSHFNLSLREHPYSAFKNFFIKLFER